MTGSWSQLYSLPLVPSSAALLPSGKLMLWSADGEFAFTTKGEVNWAVFDPASGTSTKGVFAGGHNMFCTGTTVLPDGRILANGGSNAKLTTLYDPVTNTMTRVQDMVLERGYNANTILTDGTVLTYGGTWSGGGTDRSAEIWTESSGWRRLSGMPMSAVSGSGDQSYHYWLLPAGNGKVLYAGPMPQMKWLDTSGNGKVTAAGSRGDDVYSNSGIAVMYDAGRILKAGGAPGYTGPSHANVHDIDIRTDSPAVTKLTPMTYPRMFANSVVMPDGSVFIVGGQTYGEGFSDSNAVLTPELWNPATRTTRLMAPIAVARNYHSLALLLPDGRVMSGGGGLCGVGCSANHPDLQIWTPPSHYNADGSLKARPAIVTAPSALPYGRTITVTTDRPVAAFSVVRFGATTHTVNNDQRRLALVHRQTGTNSYQIDVPSNPGWLLPGKWMLFALAADGTPSVAKVVDVAPNGIARIVGPGTIVASVGASLSVTPDAVKLKSGVVFGGTGLPDGVTVDPATGTISGSATQPGTYRAAITATDGTITVSTDFTLAIDPAPGNGTGLLADYFANTTLNGAPVLTRHETPDFDWTNQAPGPGVPATNFSVRWSGTVTALRSGVTRFRTSSDDGVRLWVGGKLLVDNWTTHAATFDEGSIDLVAGQQYPVLMTYFQGAGAATLRLNWLRPGDTDFAPIGIGQLNGPASLPTVDLAEGRAASQSSDYEGAVAGRAVDGNSNGTYGAGSVSHTGIGANPWWQVDLGSRVRVDRVRLWNRTDCCQTRLNAFSVLMSETDMTGRSYADLLADPAVAVRSVGASAIPNSIDVAGGATARYVRVQLSGTDYLHLAEVEVFGDPANAAPTIKPIAAVLGTVGVAVNLTASATDPDGDVLTYSATNLPAGLSIAAATGVISGKPTAEGSVTATVTATDPQGASASTTVPFTISYVQPTVASLTVPIAKVGVALTYAPTIRNGTGATYSWNFGDGTAATRSSTSPSTTKTWTAAGNYTVTLTLTGATGRATVHQFRQAVVPNLATTPQLPPSSGLALDTVAGKPTRLWVANPDTDTVGVLDLATNTLAAEIPVGDRPVSVAIRTGGDVWVVNRDGASISIIDSAKLTVKRTVDVGRGSRPWGLVFVNGGSDGVVTLEARQELLLVDGNGGIVGRAPAGPSPRFIAATGDGSRLLVSNFITPPLPGESTAAVQVVDGAGRPLGGRLDVMNTSNGALVRTAVLQHSEKPDTTVSARGIPNYLGAAATSPDGRFAWVPSKQDNIRRGKLRDGQNLDFQTSVRAIVSKVDLQTLAEIPAGRIDLDNAGKASAVAFHPSGAYLFVALETSRDVAVVDPGQGREIFRFRVGRAPTGLVVAPDGLTLYVQNFMDRTVSVVSLANLVKSGKTSVTVLRVVTTIRTETLPKAVLRGKQLFHDAADRRLARDGYISCAVCHENGESDGRVWDFTGFGEGVRNTISLLGHGGSSQGFLHWTANFDEPQDFEGQIRSFAQGLGLMSNSAFNAGTRSKPLGDKKAGLSADLDALAAYMTSLKTVPASPWRNGDGSNTAAAVAGSSAFVRLRCRACHAGPALTISLDGSRLRDVGTIDAASGKRAGGTLKGFDVPTLLGLFATGPYLHDGAARTIEDAIRAHKTVTVGAADLANIAAYLRELENDP